MNTRASLALFFVVALSSAACAVDPNEEPLSPTVDGTTSEVTQAVAKGTGGATGGACHVVSGANTGKSGTYNADGDCEGSWGLSECTNQDGTSSGKCADGKALVKTPITPIFGTSGGVIKASP